MTVRITISYDGFHNSVTKTLYLFKRTKDKELKDSG